VIWMQAYAHASLTQAALPAGHEDIRNGLIACIRGSSVQTARLWRVQHQAKVGQGMQFDLGCSLTHQLTRWQIAAWRSASVASPCSSYTASPSQGLSAAYTANTTTRAPHCSWARCGTEPRGVNALVPAACLAGAPAGVTVGHTATQAVICLPLPAAAGDLRAHWAGKPPRA
jgi:hypothetical protein